MKDFRDSFIEEALGLLTNLETVLLELENDPQNQSYIQEVFRTMHTLKGISSMFGFSNISEFTHDLESIYDLIRNGELKLNKRISDITLASVDHIQNLLRDPEFKNEKNTQRHHDLLLMIKQIIEDLDIEGEKAEEKNIVQDAGEDLVKTYFISFKPDEQLIFRGINIVLIFRELYDLGEYHIISHNQTEDESGKNAEYETWGIYLATKENISAIEDVFVFVLDNCKIVKISDANLFNEKDFLDKMENMAFTDAGTIDEIVVTRHKLPTAPVETEAAREEPVPVKNDFHPEEEETETEIVTLKATNESFKQISKLATNRVSVESEKLDKLMYLVSELVITRAELDLIVGSHDFVKLAVLKDKFDKLTNQFRDNTLSIRLMPINDILVRFRRLVRDLSQSMNKEIEFVTEGTETELDKNVMDALVEPILHLLRNCVDHGIESPEERVAKGKNPKGIIKLSANHSGNNVFIKIQDDGKGMDPEFIRKKAISKGFLSSDVQLTRKEILNLIFLPGFSTVQVVSDISGRGVGMDVVRKKISEIRGEVEIDSEVDSGTSFTIKLQQTISILDTLMVETADKQFLVPLSEVEFCGSEEYSEIFGTQNKHLKYSNDLIPFIHLRSELNLKGTDGSKVKYVVISKNNKKFAILIDKIIGEYQAVLKPLGNMLRKQEFLSGASIMGDGKLALMLNSDKLLNFVQNQH